MGAPAWIRLREERSAAVVMYDVLQRRLQDRRRLYLHLRRFAPIVATVFCICYLVNSLTFSYRISRPKRLAGDQVEYCDGEDFLYVHQTKVDGVKETLYGKPFNCTGLQYLRKFKLTSMDEIQDQPSKFPEDTVIVTAGDDSFYTSTRAVIAEVRRHFGNATKIIFYDLGNAEHKKDLESVCNLEYRKFNFSDLPEDVRVKKFFAWKVFILAEVFREFNNVMYMDSSIFVETADFETFFEMIDAKTLTPLQLSGNTGHGLKFATNPDMYKYIPLDPNVQNRHSMLEANLILMHRCEEVREILKFSVLCAVTPQCINPPGAGLNCPRDDGKKVGECHRQDQSVLNILIYNLEYRMMFAGMPVVPHDRKDHPKNTRQRHQTRRGQLTDVVIEQCPKSSRRR